MNRIQSGSTTPQFPTLDVSHWPEPILCNHCQRVTAYAVADQLSVCVSADCDPRGRMWLDLDAWYRRGAGKPPLETPSTEAADRRARRRALARKRRGRPL